MPPSLGVFFKRVGARELLACRYAETQLLNVLNTQARDTYFRNVLPEILDMRIIHLTCGPFN